MTGSFVDRGNQYIQLVKVLYCKLIIHKQLPIFPHKVQGLNPGPQRWEAIVLPLCHPCPRNLVIKVEHIKMFQTNYTSIEKCVGFISTVETRLSNLLLFKITFTLTNLSCPIRFYAKTFF